MKSPGPFLCYLLAVSAHPSVEFRGKNTLAYQRVPFLSFFPAAIPRRPMPELMPLTKKLVPSLSWQLSLPMLVLPTIFKGEALLLRLVTNVDPGIDAIIEITVVVIVPAAALCLRCLASMVDARPGTSTARLVFLYPACISDCIFSL